jgi:hypothetical protein
MLGDVLLQLIPYRRRRVVVLDGKRHHPVLVCHFTFSLCFFLEMKMIIITAYTSMPPYFG